MSKLVTVKTFAKLVGKTPAQIYNWEKAGKVKFKEIDGVKFVNIKSWKPQ